MKLKLQIPERVRWMLEKEQSRQRKNKKRASGTLREILKEPGILK